MLLNTIVVIFTLFWISCQACKPNETCDVNLEDTNVQKLIAGIENFTNSLITLMFNDNTMKMDINFSPICAYASLALILFGSKDTTQTELITALGLADADLGQLQTTLADILNSLQVLRTVDNRGVEKPIEQLSLAEALFLQREYIVLDPFKELLATFGAELISVDFTNNAAGATQVINRWITNETGKRSPYYFKTDVDPSTKLLLANAVYFSAIWQKNLFNTANRTSGKFRNINGEELTLTKLKTTGKLFYFDNEQSYSVVQLPFEGGDFTLAVLLPYGDIAINDFLTTFTVQEYKTAFESSKEMLVECQLPIFWTNSASSVTELLRKQMKINQIFTKANLGNMIENDKGDLFVSAIHQIGGLSITEEGVVAGGLSTVDTAVEQSLAAENAETAVPFDVDRPFILLIRHLKTNLVVFASLIREI